MEAGCRRISTTHVGSLPRPDRLRELLVARECGEAVDERGVERAVQDAVRDVVRKQIDLGLDVVSDGEQSKVGFIAYVNDRLAGFEVDSEPKKSPYADSRESRAFPEFYGRALAPQTGSRGSGVRHMVCRGPISYTGGAQLAGDLENLKAALASAEPRAAFVPAATPATIESWQRNAYYRTTEEYLYALAGAMHEEYRAIIAAGFILQLDDPLLVMRYMMDPDMSVAEAIAWAELRVEVLNHALHDLPEERIRHHTCYGINIGPRLSDLEMKHVVGLILRIRAGAYSFEAANPRHEHEWQIWETTRLPAGKSIVPGVITQSSVLVEHPELVAQRLLRFAAVVGRENVIAGADCGFASNPSAVPDIHPTIVWAKLEALVAGARLASQALWRAR